MMGPWKVLQCRLGLHTRVCGGEITTTEWVLPDVIDHEMWPSFISAWARELPRMPNRWTFGERSRIGYFLPWSMGVHVAD